MPVILLATALALLVAVPRSTAAFTVNSTADVSDNSPGNAECWTGAMVGAAKECTLRAAIQEVNVAGGSIDFSGVTSIAGSGLPTITKPVVIDGGGGAGRVELKGTASVSSLFTLVLTGGSSTITGLAFPRGLKLLTGGQNVVADNYIGTDVTGTIAKFGAGLLIEESPNNMITNNVISGNTDASTNSGLRIRGTAASGNVVTGNKIGTDKNGTAQLANGGGVVIENAPNNTIGGGAMADLNVISGSSNNVVIFGPNAAGNLIVNNYIGVDADGTHGLEFFGGAGVTITDAPNNTIGAAGLGNVISGNNNGGIEIAGATATGNKILGNLIGTDADGENDVPLSSPDHVQVIGVRIKNGASNNVIGGTANGEGNLLSGNQVGISIQSLSSTGNRILGNDIGPTQTGGSLGNTFEGVVVAGSGNAIGGTDEGAGNVIAFNGDDGVGVLGGSANAIVGNRIYSNGALGIDLDRDGVTPNDENADDADSGANNRQNFPEFFPDAHGVLQGTLDSAPGHTYRIEYFSQENCDASGNGEGETILPSATVSTDPSGVALFTPPAIARGFFLTATATELVNDVPMSTSEFSPCASPGGSQPSDAFTVDSPDDLPDAKPGDGRCATATNVCTLRAAIQESNILPKTQRITFNLPPPVSIKPGSALPIIDRALFIDGLTQPGAGSKPLVEIDGSNAGATANGLELSGGKSLVRGLVINRFHGNGIVLRDKGKNRVEGNFIGTDVTGKSGRGNEQSGILLANSTKNLIGVLANVISGNTRHGIELDTGADKNVIAGNTIGTDVDRIQKIPNLIDGIRVGTATARNLIGGDGLGVGNVIGGNGAAGIEFFQADNNTVMGNFVGISDTGGAGLGNAVGVFIDGGSKNEIGGANVISGNALAGILINQSQKNEVTANLIGTLPDGVTPQGNTGIGIRLLSASSNTIGGKKDGEGNVVAANGVGISVDGPNTTKNVIQGNFIGTDAEVQAAGLGNLIGVSFLNDAVKNTLYRNIIVGNGLGGSGLVGGVIALSGTLNSIRQNRISDGLGQSIDLGGDGRTPNDGGDGDGGANDLQNAPVLTSATQAGGKTTLVGTINSTPKTSFTLDLYFSDTCSPTAPQAAGVLLKKFKAKTDATGTGQFELKLTGPPLGPFVTATATTKNGNTSELAACIPVTGAP